MTDEGPGEYRGVAPDGSYGVRLDSATPGSCKAFDKVALLL